MMRKHQTTSDCCHHHHQHCNNNTSPRVMQFQSSSSSSSSTTSQSHSQSQSRRFVLRLLTLTLTSFLLLLLCNIIPVVDCAVPSAASAANNDGRGFPLPGILPDPFVSAAPLVVGVVCSDGVILAAVHTIFENEPLLLSSSSSSSEEEEDEEEKEKENDNNDKNDGDKTVDNNNKYNNTVEERRILKDLPRSYRGPFRIHNIDGFGTAMVCSGWRADGRILADYCRRLAADELAVYGSPGEQYGQMLASETSEIMANCAVSDQFRPLSVVALLASSSSSSSCGSSSGGNNGNVGCLWLIDGTGAYRVRAHAVGALAGVVNEKLRLMDWTKCDKTTGAKKLVQILSNLEGLPSETRIELACLSSPDSSTRTIGKWQLHRMFTSRLFGVSV